MPEIEINNFQGIFSGTVKPPKNGAYVCRNFDLRGQSGVLEQRFGYGLTFDNKPNGLSLSAITYLAPEAFYIPGIGGGQEITVQVGIGTITSERITGSQYTQAIPLIWASHSWNGSAWVAKTSGGNNWNWLNEIVCTRLSAVDPAVAGDTHKIAVDIAEDGRAAAGYFNGWYIANETEGKVHRIVDSYVWNDGVNNRIAFKLDADAIYWNPASAGRLYIMKNYIPIVSLQAMGVATRNEVTFLKIRDEIRISFGAKVDRIALAISYQKSYLNIKSFDVEAYSSALIDAYSKIDGLIVCPYSLLTDEVSLDLSPTNSGTYPANTHYVKATGVMVAGDEILMTQETKLTTTAPTALYYNAHLLAAVLNPLAKYIKFYYSNDTLLKVFYLIFEEKIRSDTREGIFIVNTDGKMVLADSSADLHDPGTTNAAAPVTATDPLNIGDWDAIQGTVTAVADAGAGSINALEFTVAVPIQFNYAGIFLSPAGGIVGLGSNKTYTIKVWLKRQVGTLFNAMLCNFQSPLMIGPGTIISFDGTWTEYTFELTTPDVSNPAELGLYMIFYNNSNQSIPIGDKVRVDRISIITKTQHIITEFTEQLSEMSAEMGYTPTRNLIKSWDTGLVTAGRTFVANVYIEKLYTNMIFYSAIGGDANSMFDVLVAGLRYDIENFDGNDVKKIELLSNADFLLLQAISSQRLDPDTGRTANIGFSSGTVQPHASVNFGDKIVFPGKYDILQTSGIGISDLSENTIRANYRDLIDADIAKMHASKDLFDQSYVLYSGKTSTRAEFILTKKGWIERRFAVEPQRYFTSRDGELRFMSAGNIYGVSKAATDDNTTNITSLWQSIIFDAETIGEQIPSDSRFSLTEFFVEFISNGDITFKTYILDSFVPLTFDTQVIPKSATLGKFTYRRPFKTGGVCSRFQLELSYTGNSGPSECSIYSIGVVFDIIKAKSHV